MATRVITRVNIDGIWKAQLYQVSGLAASDVSEVFQLGGSAPICGSLQFTGTFGGTVTFQASNDNANWVTVKDVGGNDIASSAAGMWEFSSSAIYHRISSGAGVTAVVASLGVRG